MLRCHTVSHEATEEMADTDNVLESVTCDTISAQKLDELVCDSD